MSLADTFFSLLILTCLVILLSVLSVLLFNFYTLYKKTLSPKSPTTMPSRRLSRRNRSRSRSRSQSQRRKKSQRSQRSQRSKSQSQRRMSRRQQLKKALKKLTDTLAGGEWTPKKYSMKEMKELLEKDLADRRKSKKQRLMSRNRFKRQYYTESDKCDKGYRMVAKSKRSQTAKRHDLNVCKKKRQSRKARTPKNVQQKYMKGRCSENQYGYKHKCRRQTKYAKQNNMTVCCKRKARKKTKNEKVDKRVRKMNKPQQAKKKTSTRKTRRQKKQNKLVALSGMLD